MSENKIPLGFYDKTGRIVISFPISRNRYWEDMNRYWEYEYDKELEDFDYCSNLELEFEYDKGKFHCTRGGKFKTCKSVRVHERSDTGEIRVITCTNKNDTKQMLSNKIKL